MEDSYTGNLKTYFITELKEYFMFTTYNQKKTLQFILKFKIFGSLL